MNEKVCCIFGAGDYFGDEIIPENAFVIAADAGLLYCREHGICPDVIIGDFDSLGHALDGENVVRLPVAKDDTDTLAAVKLALSEGFHTFLLFGCTGGNRFSHTLANLQTLTYLAKHNAAGFLFDIKEVTTATDKGVHFRQDASGFVSVFAAGGAAVVSEKGLKYEISRKTIHAHFPLGVSNEFVGKESTIVIDEGIAFITFPKEQKESIQWV